MRLLRQGVHYLCLKALDVVDRATMQLVPADGETLGEVVFRGNVVMKGYLKAPEATAAVVAKPDEKWGETPCAFVELKPGTRASKAELIAACRQRLAGFKGPRRAAFTRLPRTSAGKSQKNRLREAAKGLP